MTISVQLSPAQEQALAAVAERLNIPAADLAAAAVRDLVATPGDDFATAAERVLAKNRELYRRLA